MKDYNFDRELGAWLEEKRIAKGYSLQQVADKLGVTKTAVHCWEKGKRSLYAQTLMDYCNVVHADIEEFVRKEQ